MRVSIRLSTACLLGWIFGHLSLWFLSTLPSTELTIGCALLVLVVLCFQPKRLLAGCAALSLGILCATQAARLQLDTRIPTACEGQLLTVNGVIVGLPEPAEPLGVRFRFQPDYVQSHPTKCLHKEALWQLSWRADATPLPGERWRIRVKLKRPHSTENPGGFDAERWQHAEGISATGWLRSGQRLVEAPASIDLWRWRIRQRLLGQFPLQQDAAGTVLALLTGDRAGISPAAWERYARTGITHLVAISGVHITLVAWLVGYLFQTLWRRIPGALSVCSALRMGGLAGWVAAGGYVLLAGSDVPAQRTLLMLGVILLMRWLPGRFSGLQTWLAALAAVSLMAEDAHPAQPRSMTIMAGPDEQDSTVVLPSVQVKSPTQKLAYIKEIVEHPSLQVEIRDAFFEQVDKLKKEGYEVESVDFPYIEQMLPTYYVLTTAEASSNLSRFDGVKYGHRTSNPHDLMDLYKKTREEGFGEEVKRRIMLGTFVLSADYYDAYYTKAQKVRRLIQEYTDRILGEFDFIISPTTSSTAYAIGEKTADPLQMYLGDLFTVQANVTGLPAISVPMGVDTAKLPMGFQFMGPRFSEKALIEIAKLI